MARAKNERKNADRDTDCILIGVLTWCERWDSNPHGVTTRTSNVLVYHSNTLANFMYYNVSR